jgi:DNA-binding transcriptional ArsR family regulator
VHIRDRYAPWLADSAHGLVKLDLVLRGLASVGDNGLHLGAVHPGVSWEDLHDFCRDGAFYGSDRRLKRKWVNDKLARLEAATLIRRDVLAGRRSGLVVLSDRGDGTTFDDPGGIGDSYLTVTGELMEQGVLGAFGTPRLAAYLAAMNAERYARADAVFASAERLDQFELGDGQWFRPLEWFGSPPERADDHRVRLALSPRTLRRGLRELEQDGLILKEWIDRDPRTAKLFLNGPRVMYYNGFADLRGTIKTRRWVLRNRQRRQSASRTIRHMPALYRHDRG